MRGKKQKNTKKHLERKKKNLINYGQKMTPKSKVSRFVKRRKWIHGLRGFHSGSSPHAYNLSLSLSLSLSLFFSLLFFLFRSLSFYFFSALSLFPSLSICRCLFLSINLVFDQFTYTEIPTLPTTVI